MGGLISPEVGLFESILDRYEHPTARRLTKLEELRYTTIPDRIQQRKDEDAQVLVKEELQQLEDWRRYETTGSCKLKSRD